MRESAVLLGKGGKGGWGIWNERRRGKAGSGVKGKERVIGRGGGKGRGAME